MDMAEACETWLLCCVCLGRSVATHTLQVTFPGGRRSLCPELVSPAVTAVRAHARAWLCPPVPAVSTQVPVLCLSVAKMVAADGYKLECCVGMMQGAGQEIFPFSTAT